jgi:hypothetical protein
MSTKAMTTIMSTNTANFTAMTMWGQRGREGS